MEDQNERFQLVTDLGKHVQFTEVYKEALFSRRVTSLRDMIKAGQTIGPAKVRHWEALEKSEKYLLMLSAEERRAKETQSRQAKRKAMMDRVLGFGSTNQKPTSARGNTDSNLVRLGNEKDIAWDQAGKDEALATKVIVSKHATAIGSGAQRADIKSILGENNIQDVMGPAKKRALAREKMKGSSEIFDGREKAFEAINNYNQSKKREKMLKEYEDSAPRVQILENLQRKNAQTMNSKSPVHEEKSEGVKEKEQSKDAYKNNGDKKCQAASKKRGGLFSRFSFNNKNSQVETANDNNVEKEPLDSHEQITTDLVEKVDDASDIGSEEKNHSQEKNDGCKGETPKKKKVR